jgi:hypothetical protein
MANLPKITPLSDVPAVAEATTKLAGFLDNLESCNSRIALIDGNLTDAKRRTDPAELATLLRAGKPVDYSGRDLSGLEKEREALDRERETLEAAIDQQSAVVDSKVAAANEAKREELSPHLTQSDKRTATKYLEFAKSREERFDLVRELAAKGYAAMAFDIGATGVLPNLGSMSEPASPVSLVLKHLADERGLVKL